MKPTELAGVLIAAAALCGCAGGGGSGGTYSSGGGPAYRPPPAADTPCGLEVCIPYLPWFPGDPIPGSASKLPRTPLVAFSSWRDAALVQDPETDFRFNSTGSTLVYARNTASITDAWDYGVYDAGTIDLRLWQGGRFVTLPNIVGLQVSTNAAVVNLASAGQPGFDIVMGAGTDKSFIQRGADTFVLAAKPLEQQWDYQSFGVWNRNDYLASSVNQALSFGSATPSSSVPTTGTATFSGKLGGLYVSPTGEGSIATANVTVNADFSSRSLSFASSGTTITRDLTTARAVSNLNLNGTLSYSPSSNAFTGTLANAGGTMSGSSRGQFYGPTAQELGGAFLVKSPTTVEAFTGAYGAKR